MAPSTTTCQKRWRLSRRIRPRRRARGEHRRRRRAPAPRRRSRPTSAARGSRPPRARSRAAIRARSRDAQRRLEMTRRHVVRGRGDSRLGEPRSDPLPIGRAHDEHVVDVARLVERQLDGLAETQLGVARGRLPPAGVPAGEMRQEDAQGRGLDGVEPRVRADSSWWRLSSDPWKRSMRTRCATSSSVQATRPPSPRAKRFLVGKKLNVEQTPVVAIPGAPNACAASSISGYPSAGELRRARPAGRRDAPA